MWKKDIIVLSYTHILFKVVDKVNTINSIIFTIDDTFYLHVKLAVFLLFRFDVQQGLKFQWLCLHILAVVIAKLFQFFQCWPIILWLFGSLDIHREFLIGLIEVFGVLNDFIPNHRPSWFFQDSLLMEFAQGTVAHYTLFTSFTILQNNLLFLWFLLVFELAHQQVLYAGWIADSYFFIFILSLLLLILKCLLDDSGFILFVLSAWALSIIYS